jgi:hypothetical protein
MTSAPLDFPVDLLEAFDPQNGQGVVAFVGSGPSCDAGLPGWAELLRRIAAEVRLDNEVATYLERGDYLHAAQALARERSEQDIRDRVAKQIKRASRAPGDIHQLIVSIPFAGIITTNYDLLLTAADRTQNFNPPTTHQNAGIRSQLREPFLLHLHGHVGEPETIILTRQGYDQIVLDNSHVRPFLSSIFQTRAVLFIGFGFADNHVDEILRDFKDAKTIGESTVFALIPSSSSTPDKVKDYNLQFQHINPIYLTDRGDYGVAELRLWLQSLHKALARISLSTRRSVRSLRPKYLIESLNNLFVSDEWFALLASSLSALPNRPDLENLVRVSFTKADVEGLFSRLGLSEMRSILMSLNNARRHPALEDALSCFPPSEDDKET